MLALGKTPLSTLGWWTDCAEGRLIQSRDTISPIGVLIGKMNLCQKPNGSLVKFMSMGDKVLFTPLPDAFLCEQLCFHKIWHFKIPSLK